MSIDEKDIQWVHGIPHITPEYLNANAENLILVDVRTEEEYTGELSHVENSQLMPLGPEIEGKLRTLPQDKTVIFICRSGARSGRVTEFCRKENIHSDCFNMLGGMIRWNELNLPTASK